MKHTKKILLALALLIPQPAHAGWWETFSNWFVQNKRAALCTVGIGATCALALNRLTRCNDVRMINGIKYGICPGANLAGKELSKAFYPASLKEADLRNANLSNAKLMHANLYEADLSKANLTGADLTNATPTHAKFEATNLTNANLTNANLINANLTHANLTGANLTDTNLTGANLQHVTFKNVQFSNTNFLNANLDAADFTDTPLANLKAVVFEGAKGYVRYEGRPIHIQTLVKRIHNQNGSPQ